jgi:C_GCAxxG_C_C family probable redox protein
MNRKIDQVIEDFNSGFNCSQVVFSACAEQLGLDVGKANKISCGFGGGIGGTRQLCGAITGAYMVIGLKHGNSDAKDQESKKKTYALIQEFTNKFAARNSSTLCEKLIGGDRSVCVKYLKDAIEILEELE